MYQLNKTEAQVYELLKSGYAQDEIARRISRSRAMVLKILNQFVTLGLAIDDRSKYMPVFTALPGEYQIINRKSKPNPDARLPVLKKLCRTYGADNIRYILYRRSNAPVQYISSKTGIKPSVLERILRRLEAVA